MRLPWGKDKKEKKQEQKRQQQEYQQPPQRYAPVSGGIVGNTHWEIEYEEDGKKKVAKIDASSIDQAYEKLKQSLGREERERLSALEKKAAEEAIVGKKLSR